MIVSHKHRFIFLKTRKTGGTSIELALRQLCGPDDVITTIAEDGDGYPGLGPQNYFHPKSEWPASERIKWALGHRPHRVNNHPRLGFWNHTPATVARAKLGRTTWREYFKFSVERNPWDRQVSFYFWTIKRGPSRKAPFPEFLQSCSPLDNWSVYAIDDKVEVDHIIRYGDLQSSLSETLKKIGLVAPSLPNAKSNFRPKGVHYRELYDEESLETVARWHRREIDYFGWTF